MAKKETIVKKTWRELFRPTCWGNPNGKLMACVNEYFRRKGAVKCKHYDSCVGEGVRRQNQINRVEKRHEQ